MSARIFDVLNRHLENIKIRYPEILEDMWIVNPARSEDIKVLQSLVPETWAERVEPRDELLDEAIDIKADMRVIKVLLLRGAKPSETRILKLLTRTSSIERDEIYYMALAAAGIEERRLLEKYAKRYPFIANRLANIVDLFYRIDKWRHKPSVNDTTLQMNIEDVPSPYLIEFQEGNALYLLHIVELMRQSMANYSANYVNPWTNTVLPASLERQAKNALQNMAKKGFPLIELTAEDVKDKTYRIYFPTQNDRIREVMEKNALNGSFPTEAGIVAGLNPELFLALKNKRGVFAFLETPIDHGRIDMKDVMTSYSMALKEVSMVYENQG